MEQQISNEPSLQAGFSAYMAEKRKQAGLLQDEATEEAPEEAQEASAESEEESFEGQDEPTYEEEPESPENPVEEDEPEDETETSDEEIPPHKRSITELKDEEGNEQQWFSDLDETARSKVVQMERTIRELQEGYGSLHGRLAPMQRQNAELMREIDRLKAIQSTPEVSDLAESASWKEVEEEFPDESGEIKKIFSAKTAELQQAKQQLQQLQNNLAQVQSQRNEVEWMRLKARHPDVDQVRSHPRFQQWLQTVANDPNTKPDMVRKLNSWYYEDVADVIDAFKAEVFAHQPQNAPAAVSPKVPNSPPPSPPSQGAGVSLAGKQRTPTSAREQYRQYVMSKKRKR